jgi:MFS family permease
VASALGGRLLPRLGYRPFIWLGLSLSTTAALAIALVTRPGQDLNALRAASAVFGLGLGFANTALLIAVQSAVGWEQRGIATASTLFFRSIGGALAIGVTGGVLARALDADPSIPADAANRLLGPARGSGLDPAVLHRLGMAMGAGFDAVFWILFGVAACALAASLFFPHVQTRPARDPG